MSNESIRVRATAQGIYDHFKEIGDEFEIRKPADFSKNWMEKVEVEKPVVAAPTSKEIKSK